MGGRVRRVYRRLSARLPPGPRVRVTMRLLRMRRRLRARAGLLDVPGEGPAHMLIARGVDRSGLEACAEHAVARRQGGVAPLVVTDCDAFEVLRDRGLLFEYLPPAEDWSRIASGDYETFATRRLAAIAESYRVTDQVVWSSDSA